MKRSAINSVCREAEACFRAHGWALPPNPRWDVTDFGLGAFDEKGLVLINLTEEPEYCEKLMYAREGQVTVEHTHHVKKEDIICRHGRLTLRLWNGDPAAAAPGETFELKVNTVPRSFVNGEELTLEAGERVCLTPGVVHTFWPAARETIIGEVSTANDDVHDNIFFDPDIGRFPEIEEDEPAEYRLLSESGS